MLCSLELHRSVECTITAHYPHSYVTITDSHSCCCNPGFPTKTITSSHHNLRLPLRKEANMQLTLPLLVIFPLLTSAHPYKPKKPDHKPWAYKIAFINAKNRFVSPPQDAIRFQKRQQHTPNIQQSPDYPKLPPPWSPEKSHLGSPYLPQGGLSIMIDNLPNYGDGENCPDAWLECGKCSSDPRCRRYNPPDDGNAAYENENTDPDLPSIPPCPLHTCHPNSRSSLPSSLTSSCGANAECVVDHCVCARGFKGTTGSIRGYDDLQAVTVWVDTSVDCNVYCDELSCAEVEQVDVCFQRIEGGVVVVPGQAE